MARQSSRGFPSSGPVHKDAYQAHFRPLLALRGACLLLFATFLTGASLGDASSDSGCFDPLLPAVFFAAGPFSDAVSGLDPRLEPAFGLSFVSSASLGKDWAGRLDPFLVNFFTAGVLGFLAGEPFLTGVAFAGVGVSFFWTSFFGVGVAEDTPFLAGGFFDFGRPLPLA